MSRRTSVKSLNDISIPTDMFKGQSVEYLQTLNKQDEGTFVEFFQQLSLPDVKDARKKCEQMQEKNRELALKNSDLEPEFTEQKTQLRTLVTEAQDLKEEYERDYQELKGFKSRTELSSLKKQLQEAVKTSEQTSEDFAYEYVNGKTSMSVDEFIEGLIKSRSEYWLRKVKLQKFDELASSRRPVPAPRHAPKSTQGPPIPYPAPSVQSTSQPVPFNQASPMQSLPVKQQPARPMASPTSSLPPYPTATSGNMPRPTQQPFPAAAYPGYQRNPGYPPSRPPSYPSATPGYPPSRPSYPSGPPPRPAAYSQYRQHRY